MKLLRTFKGDPQELRDRADAVVLHLIKKYGRPFDYGRNRLVFDTGKFVLKFPRNAHGLIDNEWEACCQGPTKARGRMVVLDEFVCVMQEKLQRIYADVPRPEVLPSWTDSVDCSQVGYDRQGRLRAYDYGCY